MVLLRYSKMENLAFVILSHEHATPQYLIFCRLLSDDLTNHSSLPAVSSFKSMPVIPSNCPMPPADFENITKYLELDKKLFIFLVILSAALLVPLPFKLDIV